MCINDGKATRMATQTRDRDYAISLITHDAVLEASWGVLGDNGSDHLQLTKQEKNEKTKSICGSPHATLSFRTFDSKHGACLQPLWLKL